MSYAPKRYRGAVENEFVALSLHERMRRVRREDTEPELKVRRILARLGLRYRVTVRGLPGTPDIANRTNRWAVFVHGCFWHGHPGCRLATVPKTNTRWWLEKLTANRARDQRKVRALRARGIRVLTVWQCQTDQPARLERRLGKFVEAAR